MFMLFFFNDTATTEIYTLSLHDALPIFLAGLVFAADLFFWHLSIINTTVANATFFATTAPLFVVIVTWLVLRQKVSRDRKSTRLNSSHANISYAVFCLKKKKLLDDFALY